MQRHYIISDPSIIAGKPIIKGTRLSVSFIQEQLDRFGRDELYLLANYPGLSKESLSEAKIYAAQHISSNSYQHA